MRGTRRGSTTPPGKFPRPFPHPTSPTQSATTTIGEAAATRPQLQPTPRKTTQHRTPQSRSPSQARLPLTTPSNKHRPNSAGIRGIPVELHNQPTSPPSLAPVRVSSALSTSIAACWHHSRRSSELASALWPGTAGPGWRNSRSGQLEMPHRGMLTGADGHDGRSKARASGRRRRADHCGGSRAATSAHPAGRRSAAEAAMQRCPQPWAQGPIGAR
jgi:hypothetical protein